MRKRAIITLLLLLAALAVNATVLLKRAKIPATQANRLFRNVWRHSSLTHSSLPHLTNLQLLSSTRPTNPLPLIGSFFNGHSKAQYIVTWNAHTVLGEQLNERIAKLGIQLVHYVPHNSHIVVR